MADDTQADIQIARPQTYDRLFFAKGAAALEGLQFPLETVGFVLKKDISAPKPFNKILSAYELDSRNFSYPVQPEAQDDKPGKKWMLDALA